MVNNGDVIPRHVNVELDSCYAEGECPLEGRDGILGRLAISPSMGDDFGSPDHKSKLGSESNSQNQGQKPKFGNSTLTLISGPKPSLLIP
jgi:hypothetical protein